MLRIVDAREQVPSLPGSQLCGHVPLVPDQFLVFEHHFEKSRTVRVPADGSREVHEQAVVMAGFQDISDCHRQSLLSSVHLGIQLVIGSILKQTVIKTKIKQYYQTLSLVLNCT